MSSNSEIRNFAISLKIEHSDGRLIDLFGKWNIEIDWDKLGRGQVCDSEIKDGKEIKKGSSITFEKDGKNYQILVKINKIKKGWFKDKVIDYAFESFNSDGSWVVSKTSYYRRTLWGWESRDFHEKIEATQGRQSGFVLIGSLFVASLVLLIFITYRTYKRKRK